MTPSTPFRQRVEQLAKQATEAGIGLADLIVSQDDAARLERMILGARERKLTDEFRALVARDPKAAAKAFDEPARTGRAPRLVAALEQDELINWLRKLPEAARERVLAFVSSTAFVRAQLVPDADVPKYVEVRGRGAMDTSTDPREIDQATAQRLRDAGVPVRAPKRITMPHPEPDVYPGLALVDNQGVFTDAAWKAILSVDPRARAYVDAGELIVTPMPIEFGRVQLQRAFAQEAA